jgi:hypothetical protein
MPLRPQPPVSSLHAQHPNMGENVAIDGSDLPAYANGQRFLSKNGPERERYSDPDASLGQRSAVSARKGGGFYGYKSTPPSAPSRALRSLGRSRRRVRPRRTSRCR